MFINFRPLATSRYDLQCRSVQVVVLRIRLFGWDDMKRRSFIWVAARYQGSTSVHDRSVATMSGRGGGDAKMTGMMLRVSRTVTVNIP